MMCECMYCIRVCVDVCTWAFAFCHMRAHISLCARVCVSGCVCMLASYPAPIPQQQSDCLLALFQSPFLLTPTQLSCLSLLLFFQDCPPPRSLPHWVMHWSFINSFISIFLSLRCLCNSSDYSTVAHIIKQANVLNSLYDKIVGG